MKGVLYLVSGEDADCRYRGDVVLIGTGDSMSAPQSPTGASSISRTKEITTCTMDKHLDGPLPQKYPENKYCTCFYLFGNTLIPNFCT